MRPGGWHAASQKIGLAVHRRARRHLKSSVCSLNYIASGAYLESDKRHDKTNKVVELRKPVTRWSPIGRAGKGVRNGRRRRQVQASVCRSRLRQASARTLNFTQCCETRTSDLGEEEDERYADDEHQLARLGEGSHNGVEGACSLQFGR